MKFLNTLRNRMRKSLISNQSGQGATEYILLLVVVVGLLTVFKEPIKNAMKSKSESVGNKINEFNGE